jgi:hypothetical protein
MQRFGAMVGMTLLAHVLAPSAPRAQVPDHLKCYKIKDSAARATYTADLGGLAPEPGCLVKVPGKLLCVQTAKTNVSPTPPGAPAATAAGQFICYKVKCPKGTPAAVTVTDQFGARSVQPSAAKFLCAPVQGAVPTTTTAAPTTTTSTSTTTTTTLPVYTCSLAGGSLCGGSCPPGYTCSNFLGTCGCTNPTSCGDTSGPPACSPNNCPYPGTCGLTFLEFCICGY